MKANPLLKLTKALAPAILLLMRTKLKSIEGNLPEKGPIVIASHHEGWQDPFIIVLSLKRYAYWVCDTRPLGIPLIDAGFYKKFLMKLGIIPIDKVNTKRNKFLYKTFTQLIKKGEVIVIFPEGNLKSERKGKRLGKARDGVVKLTRYAQKELNKQIPIYPIGFEYKKGFIMKSHLKIGKPIHINNNTNEKVLKKIMKEIAHLSNIRWQE